MTRMPSCEKIPASKVVSEETEFLNRLRGQLVGGEPMQIQKAIRMIDSRASKLKAAQEKL